MTIRNEYPRPQLVREAWLNLNGEWDFEIDNGENGLSKKFYQRDSLDQKIIVPFCPESKLSGIGNVDFMNCVWYRKDFNIPGEWAEKRILLNFGAVDYKALVYVNGNYVGEHKGGYTPFSFDITEQLVDCQNYITLCAIDHVRSSKQPVGKQSMQYHSQGCSYTRTTGIWQTVWLEPVSKYYVKSIKPVSDIETGSVNITLQLSDYAIGCNVKAKACYEGKYMGEGETTVNAMSTSINILLQEKHLWDVGVGNLYDLEITVSQDDVMLDSVKSYFGLRSVGLTQKALVLNGRKVFGRWVLDQGFYPDGIYTAPTDEDLKNDIIYSMQLGFNGARMHQKIFEPRYIYWADRLGYMLWGEHGNWGLSIWDLTQIEAFLPEWMEAVERDYAHPSIIGWCPFNETWDCDHRRQSDTLLKMVYDVTKAIDTTRPVIDTSGNFHVVTDIYDVHEYCQNVDEFATMFKAGIHETFTDRQKYGGQPYYVSEYGGMKWSDDNSSWGYGNAPITKDELIERYKGLTDVLLDDPDCCAFCYTQLYDVEQEQNGLLTYDRKFKFDPQIFYQINSRKATVEE